MGPAKKKPTYTPIGAVSVRQGPDGTYLEGFLQVRKGGRKAPLLLLKNTSKNQPHDPDYILFRGRKKRR